MSEALEDGVNDSAEMSFKKLELEKLFKLSFSLSAAVISAFVGLAFLIHDTPSVHVLFTSLSKFLAVRQDIPIAAFEVLFFLWLMQRRNLHRAKSLELFGRGGPLGPLIFSVGTACALRFFFLFDFDLSRDEQMVAFDAAIYGRGLTFAPFPPAWRDWYSALNTTFILPIGDREGWVSAYLPGNAALHALLSKVGLESFTSPLLLLTAGLALWRIARLIWPESPGTQAAVLLLFVGSSQAILMGTTRHAMTAHLAANLVWLWLFLQNRFRTHGAAIAIGFLATGLHQPLFHPLFVVPFLDLMRRQKRWGLLSVYALAYLAIGLFWLNWPSWVSGHGLHPVPSQFHTEGVSYFERLRSTATTLSPVSFGLMAVNLLRFVTWQHLLLLPLTVLGVLTAYRAEPICRALVLGILLTITAMLLIIPAQGHGWGYRYLHGFIGSAVLIAGFGWHRLESTSLVPVQLFRWATALSLLVLLPAHAYMMRTIVAPYAKASFLLKQTPADVVVIDDWSTPFAADLVQNQPDLTNRPIMLGTWALAPETLSKLCAGGRRLAFPDARPFSEINQLFGNNTNPLPSSFRQPLLVEADRVGCRVIPSAQTSAKAAAIRVHE